MSDADVITDPLIGCVKDNVQWSWIAGIPYCRVCGVTPEGAKPLVHVQPIPVKALPLVSIDLSAYPEEIVMFENGKYTTYIRKVESL